MKSKRILLLFVFHCSLFIDHWSLIYAQCWPTTTDSAITVASGWYPYAAVDEQEQSVMVVYLAGAQIRVKKYSKYGCPMWGGNPAIGLDTIQKAWLGFYGNQWGQVISDDSGGVIICWKDFRHSDMDPEYPDTPVNDEVYIQRIDVNGFARYGPNGIRASGPHTDGRRIIGDMKTDYHNGFYIAYSGDSLSTKEVLKHYDRNGNLLWEKYFVSSGYFDLNATDNQGSCFASSLNKRYKFDYNGNSLWPDTLIGRIPDDIEFRRGGAFSDNNGGVIGLAGRYQSAYFIYTNRADSSGQFLFGEGINITNGVIVHYSNDCIGGIFLSWTNIGAIIQRVTKEGIIKFNPELLLCKHSNCYSSKGIISNGKSNAIVVWGDRRFYPSYSFFAQKIDSSGNILWDTNGVEFHTTNEDLFFEYPVKYLQSDNRDGVIMIWMQLGSGLNIMLKQISRNGIIGEVDSTISINNDIYVSKQFDLYQNHPNPFNNSTTIKYKLRKEGKVQLKLYNILGQEVKTLDNEFKWEGIHQYQLDMNQYASGVYIYRLITSEGTKSKKLLFIK